MNYVNYFSFLYRKYSTLAENQKKVEFIPNKNLLTFMNELFTNNIQRIIEFKDWTLPGDFKYFTLNDWIEPSGAELIN